MARLALALDSQVGEGDRRVPIDRRMLRTVVAALGETILLYRFVAGSFVLFFASGKVAGVEIGADRVSLSCRLREVSALPVPPFRNEMLAVPGVQRLLSLTPEVFDAVLQESRTPLSEQGAAEAASMFAGPLRKTAVLDLYRQVLAGWGHRCAVTGRAFAPGPSPHPDLRLAFLRPRNQGGPLHVSNLMPMIGAAEDAWTRGVLSATQDHQIVAVVEELSLALFDQIERVGRLHLPEDRHFWPDPDHLAYHRAQVFRR